MSNAAGVITADEICATLVNEVNPGRTQETIRKYIRVMVKSGDYLIGSSNQGYFAIETPVQALDAINYLESRIPDLQDRANRIRHTWNAKNPNNQI